MEAAIVITARLGSSRLPRKVLTPLRGRPALDRLVERLRTARLPERIVLATTTEPEDDALESIAGALGVDVFRGDPDDILVRWRDAARALDIELLVTCDGDDTFCDPVHVDRVVERWRETGADYIACVGLPFGAAPTGIARAGLERVCELKQETHTEGQGRFFEDESIVKRAEVQAPESVRNDEVRMTLDYPDDTRFFEAVIAELEEDGRVFSLEEIVALLRRRPDIVAINSHLQAEYWARFRERYPAVELGS
ncbi:MAG: spore coat polysaccharide biosynthesis protein SpsF [Thermoleophilaceae bacterium]|nr:spore coat polysaccharide biosynthesis protein SpsF [Thermoleophilaceae bacterium]